MVNGIISYALLALGALGSIGARHPSHKELHAMQVEAAKSFKPTLHDRPFKRKVTVTTKDQTCPSKTPMFANPKAKKFYVDGKSIPEVDFDVGPSWSGLMPISGHTNETRKLFFWFFPPGPQGSKDDLIFWTNGGPGCSSLEGALQENGPFSWSWGQAKPTVNEYSWTNLSSILYVEQPVGTGYSQGVPNIKDEQDLAKQLVGFMQQFLLVFSELKQKKLWLTGESYAGQYIPYIADYIYKNPKELDLKLKGIWIGSPAMSWDVVQTQIAAVDFVHKYENVFAFPKRAMTILDRKAKECGYAGYMDKYVTYPPKGLLPLPGNSTEYDEGCDLWYGIVLSALTLNPAFNIYRIFDTYPVLWDVLGYPGTFPSQQTSPVYFNRPDVKKAIHAPNVEWTLCSDDAVFHTGDASLPSSFSVLPGVIEKSERSVIMHGLAEFILLAEGSRIAIQNMTWGGKQGFQTPILQDSFIIDGVGPLGHMHLERKLAYYEVQLSGHMIPQFAPWAAYQSMQYLLGFRKNP